MASLTSLLALGLRLTIPAAAAPLEARADTPSVTIANGTYIGLHSPEYDQDFFLGIPYAQVIYLGAALRSLSSNTYYRHRIASLPHNPLTLHGMGQGTPQHTLPIALDLGAITGATNSLKIAC